MHIYYSNGIAAIEIGLFVEAIKSEGVTLADLKKFAGMWTDSERALSPYHASKFKPSQYKGGAFLATTNE